MKQKLLIVNDLGPLRAYRRTQTATGRQPHLKLIEEFKVEGAHQKHSDEVSDQVGRSPRGGGAANISGDLSAEDDVTNCSIAISVAIQKQLLEAMDSKALSKIGKVLASNLTKDDPQALDEHFACVTT